MYACAPHCPCLQRRHGGGGRPDGGVCERSRGVEWPPRRRAGGACAAGARCLLRPSVRTRGGPASRPGHCANCTLQPRRPHHARGCIARFALPGGGSRWTEAGGQQDRTRTPVGPGSQSVWPSVSCPLLRPDNCGEWGRAAGRGCSTQPVPCLAAGDRRSAGRCRGPRRTRCG